MFVIGHVKGKEGVWHAIMMMMMMMMMIVVARVYC